MIMRATQKKMMSKLGDQHRRRIKDCELLGLVRPAQRGEGPERGREPRVENVGISYELVRATTRTLLWCLLLNNGCGIDTYCCHFLCCGWRARSLANSTCPDL